MSSENREPIRVSYLVQQVKQVLRVSLEQALGSQEISLPQAMTLVTIDRYPGLSNAELAQILFITPQSMLDQVVALEAAGLVMRQPRGHGRTLDAVLTEAGRLRVQGCLSVISDVENDFMKDLSSQEAANLKDLLERCVRSVLPSLNAAGVAQANGDTNQ